MQYMSSIILLLILNIFISIRIFETTLFFENFKISIFPKFIQKLPLKNSKILKKTLKNK